MEPHFQTQVVLTLLFHVFCIFYSELTFMYGFHNASFAQLFSLLMLFKPIDLLAHCLCLQHDLDIIMYTHYVHTCTHIKTRFLSGSCLCLLPTHAKYVCFELYEIQTSSSSSANNYLQATHRTLQTTGSLLQIESC